MAEGTMLSSNTDDSTGSQWAVYDQTLLRFVTGAHPSKAAAEAELSKEKGHRYTTRQV